MEFFIINDHVKFDLKKISRIDWLHASAEEPKI